MSILHVNQIRNKIKEMFSDLLDMSDINKEDSQYETYILTRSLAAYAIFINAQCTKEEAARSVVDGQDDNGVDAIYYSELKKTLYLVQSKWNNSGSGEPSQTDLMKFERGIKDLLDCKFENFNSKVENKKSDLESILAGFGNKLAFILIDTGARTQLSEHAKRIMDSLVLELNDTGDETVNEIAEFKELNQSKIFDSLAEDRESEKIDLELALEQWGKVESPYSALYGMVCASEIYHHYNEYKEELFKKNIRLMLGNTDVNEEINETIKNKPEHFWYFNNGITIIVDKFTKSARGGSSNNFGTFKLENVSIVNGAQTVSTIGKCNDIEKLNDAKIHVRIITLDDTPDRFGENVTKTNNRQNNIENKDFVSHDPEQIRIKKELSIDDITYSILRSESTIHNDTSFDLNEATISLACDSDNPSIVVQSKRGIGKFYDDLDKGIYKAIFNASVTGMYVYNCVMIVRDIEKIIKQEILKLEKKSGKHYGLLIHGNRMIIHLTIKSFGIIIPSVEKINLEELDIEGKVLESISKISVYLESTYPDSVLGTLFKNTTKCTDIVNNY